MAAGKDDSPLAKVFGSPGCRRLLRRLRERLRRGLPLTGRITLASPGAEERAAIEGLYGRRPNGGRSITLSLDELDARLREAGLAPSLEAAVTCLAGPVVDRKTELDREREAWEAALAPCRRPSSPVPAAFLEAVRAHGLHKRFGTPEAARRKLEELDVLARHLPARGEPLGRLAARLFGDSHALDHGRPLAGLALRLIPFLVAFEEDPAAPRSERRREAWAAVGVPCDALSAPPLVLDLPSSGDHFLGDLLRRASSVGEPVPVTLRQLLRYPLCPDANLVGTPVFVCENPTIMALAAEGPGPGGHPLVCINGEPATPARTLLRQLREAGADLRYHGDFDWPGVRIAARLFRYCDARPWRFDAAAYRAAPKQNALAGDPVDTPWDPDLSLAMRSIGKSVHEEAVAATLLEDLQR
jgi:uncharacterized protein (TIGR02679 family)